MDNPRFQRLLALQEPIFLSEIGDRGKMRLRAALCVGGHRPLPRDLMGKHVDEISRMPIEYTAAPYLELIWDRYFWFSVQDESHARVRGTDEHVGRGIRRFKRSWLLEKIPEISNGTHASRGELMHFGLYCMNHTVDVLAFQEPSVAALGERGIPPQLL